MACRQWLKIGSLLSILVYLTSCDHNRAFEKNETLSDKDWNYDHLVRFDVSIEDNSTPYNLFINVRHSQQYEWKNLWVVLHTTFPDSSSTETRIDLPLAEKDGKWIGKCTGDICQTQIPIQMNAVFPDTGMYAFSIEQNMRENPLANILGMGLRIERSEQ